MVEKLKGVYKSCCTRPILLQIDHAMFVFLCEELASAWKAHSKDPLIQDLFRLMGLAKEIPKSMQTFVDERMRNLKMLKTPSKTSSPAKPKQRAASFGRPVVEELKPQSPQKGMKRKKTEEQDELAVDSEEEDRAYSKLLLFYTDWFLLEIGMRDASSTK